MILSTLSSHLGFSTLCHVIARCVAIACCYQAAAKPVWDAPASTPTPIAGRETIDSEPPGPETRPADDPGIQLAIKLQKASVGFYYRDDEGRIARRMDGSPRSTFGFVMGPDEDGRFRFTERVPHICGLLVQPGSDEESSLTGDDIARIPRLFSGIEMLHLNDGRSMELWARQLRAFASLKEFTVSLPLVDRYPRDDHPDPWTLDDRKRASSAVLEGIVPLRSLERLELTCDLGNEDIAGLARFSHLRELTLTYRNREYYDTTSYIPPVHNFTAETLSEALAELKELRALDTTGCELHGQMDWEVLGRLPHLESLRIAWSGIDDSRLAGIESVEQLKTLDLSHSEITDRSLDVIAKLDKLEMLDLENTCVADNILALADLPDLREVNFPCESFQDYPLSLPELEFFIRVCKSGDRAPVERSKDAPLSHINRLVPGGITGLDFRGSEATSEIRLWYARPQAGGEPEGRGMVLARPFTDADFADIDELATLGWMSIQCTHSALLPNRHIARLASLKNLQTLELKLGRPITVAELSGLAGMPSLTSLILDDVELDEEAMASVATMPSLNTLRLREGTLRLGALRPLARAASLKTLTLRSLSIEGPAGARLRDVKNIPTLEDLTVESRDGNDAECRWIGQSKSLKKLTFHGTFSNESLACLMPMENLESLNLQGNITITEDGLRVLGGNPKLKWVAINNNGHRLGHTNNIYSDSVAREFEIGFAGACGCGCMDIEPPEAKLVPPDRYTIEGNTLALDPTFVESLDEIDPPWAWSGKLRISVPIEGPLLRIERSDLPRRLEGLYLNNCRVRRLDLVDCFLSEIGVFDASRVSEVRFSQTSHRPDEGPEGNWLRSETPSLYLGDVDTLLIRSAPSLQGLFLNEGRNLRWLRLVGEYPNFQRLHVGVAPRLQYLAAPYSGHAPKLRFGHSYGSFYQLLQLPSLRLLKMPGTAIESLVTVSPTPTVKKPWPLLHEVDLRRTKIDDQWLEFLARVRSLRILRIAGCGNLSDEAIAAFRKSRPDVDVVRDE